MKEPNQKSDAAEFEHYLKQFKPTPPAIELDQLTVTALKPAVFENATVQSTQNRTWLWIAASWLAGLIMGNSAVMATRATVAVNDNKSFREDVRASEELPAAIATDHVLIDEPQTASDNQQRPRPADANLFVTNLVAGKFNPSRTSEEKAILSARGYLPRSNASTPFALNTPARPNLIDNEFEPSCTPLNHRSLIQELLNNPTI